jgi:hypothetical protein
LEQYLGYSLSLTRRVQLIILSLLLLVMYSSLLFPKMLRRIYLDWFGFIIADIRMRKT